MKNIFIPTELSFYKTYKPGSYKDLSIDERMFYINLIKSSKAKSSLDFSYINFINEYQEYDVEDNLHDFFSDMCEHINKILNKELKDTYYLFNHHRVKVSCDDFTNDEYTQRISSINWNDKENKFVINMEYDQTADYVYFENTEFVDDNKIYEAIDNWIKNYLSSNYGYINIEILKYCSEFVQKVLRNIKSFEN